LFIKDFSPNICVINFVSLLIYKDGKVELTEMPSGINTERVIVTFLSTTVSVDLPSRGINAENATIFSHIDTKGAEGGF